MTDFLFFFNGKKHSCQGTTAALGWGLPLAGVFGWIFSPPEKQEAGSTWAVVICACICLSGLVWDLWQYTRAPCPALCSGAVTGNGAECCVIVQISHLFGVENLLRQSSFPSIIRSIDLVKKNTKFSGAQAIF